MTMEINEAIERIKGAQPFTFGRGPFADAVETLVAFAEWKMRDANIEEIKNTNNYLKSISKPTELHFIEPPKEASSCDKCPNNPKNGGSGICNCTIGLLKIRC